MHYQGGADTLEVRIYTGYKIQDKQQYNLQDEEEFLRLLKFLESKFGIKVVNEKGSWW